MEHIEHKGKMAEVVDPQKAKDENIFYIANKFKFLFDNDDRNTLLNLMYLIQDSFKKGEIQLDKITKDEARKIIWKLIMDNGDFGYVDQMSYFMVLANYNLFDIFVDSLITVESEDFKNIF